MRGPYHLSLHQLVQMTIATERLIICCMVLGRQTILQDVTA
jgi:hypothetical protein